MFASHPFVLVIAIVPQVHPAFFYYYAEAGATSSKIEFVAPGFAVVNRRGRRQDANAMGSREIDGMVFPFRSRSRR
jgi:hypothetical protein